MQFRIGVMQLTMEPLDEMLASARAMDDAGMDTIWLAEAYPWWRKHGMEARSSTGVAALMGRETKRLTIGWGIIAASTRHPVQAAKGGAGSQGTGDSAGGASGTSPAPTTEVQAPPAEGPTDYGPPADADADPAPGSGTSGAEEGISPISDDAYDEKE